MAIEEEELMGEVEETVREALEAKKKKGDASIGGISHERHLNSRVSLTSCSTLSKVSLYTVLWFCGHVSQSRRLTSPCFLVTSRLLMSVAPHLGHDLCATLYRTSVFILSSRLVAADTHALNLG